MDLQKLPSEVCSLLRTGVAVTSVAQCIHELVTNSLDAGATAIAVRVDFRMYKIQVIDNGIGISDSNLDLLGQRYLTSKCRSIADLQGRLDKFGYRGEALASLVEVSGLLTISSRLKKSSKTYSKVFAHGQGTSVGLTTPNRPCHGTTVTVQDFLYNMPVRRKNIKEALDVEEIKTQLETLHLVHPNVTFSLKNEANGRHLLHTHKCSSTVDAFRHLYGSKLATSLRHIDYSEGNVQVVGHIAKEVYHQKSLQFVYINNRVVLKTKLHKLINLIMSKSFLLKSQGPWMNLPIPKDMSERFGLPVNKKSKHAVFVINLKLPYHDYDITLDPRKTNVQFRDSESVMQCVEQSVKRFLERESLTVPGASVSEENSDQEDSPSSQSPPREEVSMEELFQEEAPSKERGSPQLYLARAVQGLTAKRKPSKPATPKQMEPPVVYSPSSASSTVTETESDVDEDPLPSALRSKKPKSHAETKRTYINIPTGKRDKQKLSLKSSKPSLIRQILPQKDQHIPSCFNKLKSFTLGANVAKKGISHGEPTKKKEKIPEKTKKISLLDVRASKRLLSLDATPVPARLVLDHAPHLDVGPHSLLLSSPDSQEVFASPQEPVPPAPPPPLVAPAPPPPITEQPSHLPTPEPPPQSQEPVIQPSTSEPESQQDNFEFCPQISVAPTPPVFESSPSVQECEPVCDEIYEDPIPSTQIEAQECEYYEPESIPAPEHDPYGPYSVDDQEYLHFRERSPVREVNFEPPARQSYVCDSEEMGGRLVGELEELSREINQTRYSMLSSPLPQQWTESPHFLSERLKRAHESPSPCNGPRKLERFSYCKKPKYPARVSASPAEATLQRIEQHILELKNLTKESPYLHPLRSLEQDAPRSFTPVMEYQATSPQSSFDQPRGAGRDFDLVNRDNVFLAETPQLSRRFGWQTSGDTSATIIQRGPPADLDPVSAQRTVTLEPQYSASPRVNLPLPSPPAARLSPHMAEPTSHLYLFEPTASPARENRPEEVTTSAMEVLDAPPPPPPVQTRREPQQQILETMSAIEVLKQLDAPLPPPPPVQSRHEPKQQILETMSAAEIFQQLDSTLSLPPQSIPQQLPEKDLLSCEAVLQRLDPPVQSAVQQPRPSTPPPEPQSTPFMSSAPRNIIPPHKYKSPVTRIQNFPAQVIRNRNVQCERREKINQEEYSVVSRSILPQQVCPGSQLEGVSCITIATTPTFSSTLTTTTLISPTPAQTVVNLVSPTPPVALRPASITLTPSTPSSVGSSGPRLAISELSAHSTPLVTSGQHISLVPYSSSSESEEEPGAKEKSWSSILHAPALTDDSAVLFMDTGGIVTLPPLLSPHFPDPTTNQTPQSTPTVQDSLSTKTGESVDTRVIDTSESVAAAASTPTPSPSVSSAPATPATLRDWDTRSDALGRVFYVSRRSGNITYTAPSEQQGFTMTPRLAFMPKGTSPVLRFPSGSPGPDVEPLSELEQSRLKEAVGEGGAFENELATVKWDKLVDKPHDKISGFEQLVQRLLSESSAASTPVERPISSTSVQGEARLQASLAQYKFTKDMLGSFKVLGQWDSKFVLTAVSVEGEGHSPSLLVLFDQHAVHERVRLERLTREYQRGQPEACEFRSEEVTPALGVELSEREVRMALNFSNQFRRLGLQYEAVSSTVLQVSRVPCCLKQRDERQRGSRGRSLGDLVQSVIQEQASALLQTRGVGARVPPTLQAVLNSEACTGAIKFGDPLTDHECELLLTCLASCQLPFQCAHGRPVLAPILDLKLRNPSSEKVEKPRLSGALARLRRKLST